MYRYGRKPRTFNSTIPHMSSFLSALNLPAPPVSVDWTHGINDFGMMLNDTLGDCTCAAVFHARQIWTANTLTEVTEPDSNVLALYEQACGYQRGNPNSDQGGSEQEVLSYLQRVGIPIGQGSREKILAFVEVDVRNIDDVKRTINDCGVAYIGFNVPNSLFDGQGNPQSVWTVNKSDESTEGGHAVILAGYDSEGATVISWGQKFKMTWEFFSTFTDECYAIADPSWFAKTGKTPLGMSIPELEALMAHLR